MQLRDAWNICEHGKSFSRPTGLRIEKWMSEKPGMPSSLERWIKENIDIITIDDMMAGDWEVENNN